VLQAQPDNSGARLNLGVALSEQGQLDEAVTVFEEVLKAKPDFAQAYNSLGVTRLHQGRVKDGLAAFEQGLAIQPDDPDTHLNRALSWLLLGDYDAGWVEYEWRWKLKKAMPCPYPQPVWDGTPLPGGTILLWSEQGLGDTLQFVRYAALVKERVGTVLLDCPGPLRGLLVSCPGVDALAGSGAPLPPADVQAPLLSLPRILGTTLESVPASVPYLFADASLQERWRQRIGAGGGLKVGLVWQGNPQFAGDRYRSVRLEHFRALAEVSGVRLFSLQKGKGSEQLGEVAGKLNLDLLISVDTAPAHLAGALGVPVWLLLPFNPDWRWLLGREDSVWYPSARLFRQRRWGDWDDVFACVADALRRQALRPLLQRLPVGLGLAEVVERAVAEGLHNGQAGASAAALRQAGCWSGPRWPGWPSRPAENKTVEGQLPACPQDTRRVRDGPTKNRRRVSLAARQKSHRSCAATWAAARSACLPSSPLPRSTRQAKLDKVGERPLLSPSSARISLGGEVGASSWTGNQTALAWWSASSSSTG
jgi:hypothetical protein